MTDPVPSESTQRFLAKATRQYHQALTLDAENYLINERGLTVETLQRFRLGSVDGALPGHEPYTGCLSIPYLTPDGRTVALRFRNLTDRGPKYLSVPGDISRLFNPVALERNWSSICVCEGEIDCITVEQAGLSAVGIPGAESWQPVWRVLFLQYDTVFVLADDDEPGRKLAKTMARDLDNVRLVPMTGGDANSFYREFGPGELRRKVGLNG